MKSAECKAVMTEVMRIAKSRKIVQDTLRAIFINPELELHERWEIFSKAVENFVYHEESNFVVSYDFMDEMCYTWYDDFFIDRYQTANMVEIYDQIFENLTYKVDEDEMTNERLHEVLPMIQEEIMAKGYSHMCNDW